MWEGIEGARCVRPDTPGAGHERNAVGTRCNVCESWCSPEQLCLGCELASLRYAVAGALVRAANLAEDLRSIDERLHRIADVRGDV